VGAADFTRGREGGEAFLLEKRKKGEGGGEVLLHERKKERGKGKEKRRRDLRRGKDFELLLAIEKGQRRSNLKWGGGRTHSSKKGEGEGVIDKL